MPSVVPDLLGWINAHSQASSSSSGDGGGQSAGKIGGVGIHQAQSPGRGPPPKSWLSRAGLLRDKAADFDAAVKKAKDSLMQKARERTPSCPPQPSEDTVPAVDGRSRAASTSPRGRRSRGPSMTSLLGMMTLLSCAGPVAPYQVPGCNRPVFVDSGCTTNVFDKNDPTLSNVWKTDDQPMDTLGGKAPANKRGRVKVPLVGNQEAILAPTGTPNCISMGRQVQDFGCGFSWLPEGFEPSQDPRDEKFRGQPVFFGRKHPVAESRSRSYATRIITFRTSQQRMIRR